MDSWFTAFVFFLPAGLANMAPVLANKVPGLNRWKTPLDFGRSYHGQRIFGTNKTWRGVVCGTVLAGLAAYLLAHLLPEQQLFDTVAGATLAGALMGCGALLGDAVESFFKRRAGVRPGHSWFPFDQIDYIIGGLLAALLFLGISDWQLYLQVLVLYFALHLAVSYIGYVLGFKDKPI